MTGQESAQIETAREVRRGWIIFFGVLELLIGAILGLLSVLAMVFALFSENIFKTATPLPGGLALVFPILFYGAAAMLFLFAGAGTLGRRHWARILMLVVSWFWLVFGTLGAAMVLLMLPYVLEQPTGAGQAVSGEVRALAWILFGGVAILFSVVLPGSFILFYSRKSVKAAFAKRGEELDSRRRMPLPIAILTIWFGLAAVGSLFSIPYGLLVLFGSFITGAPAVALVLVNAGFQGFLAWRIVRREQKIWWTAFVYYLLWGLSGVVSFLRIPMSELLAAMGSSQFVEPTQRQVMKVMQSYLPWFMLIGQVLFLGLILFAKRYFRPDADIGEPLATS